MSLLPAARAQNATDGYDRLFRYPPRTSSDLYTHYLLLTDVTPAQRTSKVAHRQVYWNRRLWKELIAEKLPEAPQASNRGACRYSYAFLTGSALFEKHGDDHPYPKQWLRNQATVFKNCQERSADIMLPERTWQGTEEWSGQAEKDFTYQIAAAHYYSGIYQNNLERLAEGVAQFSAIGSDDSSPHRDAALYNTLRNEILALNSLQSIRQPGTSVSNEDYPKLAAIYQQLESYSRNAMTQHDRERFWELVDYFDAFNAWRIDERLAILHRRLNSHISEEIIRIGINKRDNNLSYDWFISDTPQSEIRYEAQRQVARTEEAMQWILAFQAATRPIPTSDREKASYARLRSFLEKKRASTGELKWLVILAINAPVDTPYTEDIVSTAFTVTESVANGSADYKQQVLRALLFDPAIRLLSLNGDHDRAQQLIRLADADLERTSSVYNKTTIKYLSLLLLDGKISEFKSFLPTVSYQSSHSYDNLQNFFAIIKPDTDEFIKTLSSDSKRMSAVIRNSLNPAHRETLLKIAQLGSLHPEDRADMVRVAWTRGFLLRDEEFMKKAEPLLRELSPEIDALFQNTEERLRVRTPYRSALYVVLNVPRMTPHLNARETSGFSLSGEKYLMTIDMRGWNTNNWWCAQNRRYPYRSNQGNATNSPFHNYMLFLIDKEWYTELYGKSKTESRFEQFAQEFAREFLSDIESYRNQDASSERQHLRQIKKGPEMLSREVIEWVDSPQGILGWFFNRDPLIPEAMHLAVRATRYGCRVEGGHAQYSWKVYHRLHRRYPFSEWAENTPYWYDRPGRRRY